MAFRFLDLPYDVRLQIYRELVASSPSISLLCFLTDNNFPFASKDLQHPSRLFRTCKQIHSESAAVYWSCNTFALEEWGFWAVNDRASPDELQRYLRDLTSGYSSEEQQNILARIKNFRRNEHRIRRFRVMIEGVPHRHPQLEPHEICTHLNMEHITLLQEIPNRFLRPEMVGRSLDIVILVGGEPDTNSDKFRMVDFDHAQLKKLNASTHPPWAEGDSLDVIYACLKTVERHHRVRLRMDVTDNIRKHAKRYPETMRSVRDLTKTMYRKARFPVVEDLEQENEFVVEHRATNDTPSVPMPSATA